MYSLVWGTLYSIVNYMYLLSITSGCYHRFIWAFVLCCSFFDVKCTCLDIQVISWVILGEVWAVVVVLWGLPSLNEHDNANLHVCIALEGRPHNRGCTSSKLFFVYLVGVYVFVLALECIVLISFRLLARAMYARAGLSNWFCPSVVVCCCHLSYKIANGRFRGCNDFLTLD